MAATPEALFNEKLQIFWNEANQYSQFLYAYLALHALASTDERVHRAINEDALFWNTILSNLQTSFFTVLGRIFDANGQHGPRSLLAFAQANAALFSRAALRARKQPIFRNDVAGLERYVREAAEPSPREFARLDRLVRLYTAIYDAVYRELRNRVFAHKVYARVQVIEPLLQRTNVNDLQRIATFLTRLHEALQSAFENGRRLTLRPARSSVHDMLAHPKAPQTVKPIAEETVSATDALMRALAAARAPVLPDDPPN